MRIPLLQAPHVEKHAGSAVEKHAIVQVDKLFEYDLLTVFGDIWP